MIIMSANNTDYGKHPNTGATIQILAADWQVSEDMTFSRDKIKIESLNNKESLTSLVLGDSLDPNVKWCGRVRHLLSTGWTEWSNIDVFTPTTTESIVANDDIPTRVSIPIITTDSDPANHDSTLFTITAEGFSVIGNAGHVATTYFIEDMNSNVIWSNEYDLINKTKFTVRDIVLQSGALYRIKAMFHASSNDTSLIASKSILVDGGKEINLAKYLDVIKHDEDYEIEINKIDGVDSFIFEIIALDDNNSLVVWKKETTGENYNKATIPANTLKRDKYYYLRVKSKKEGSSFKYMPFRVHDFTNTDFIPKNEKKIVLYVDNETTRVPVGGISRFNLDYYETINHIIKVNGDRKDLEVVYYDQTSDKELANLYTFEVDLEKEEIKGLKKGHGRFIVRHKTNKQIKSEEVIITVE